jgi:hypothetical protein
VTYPSEPGGRFVLAAELRRTRSDPRRSHGTVERTTIVSRTRRAKLILALVCLTEFLGFVDTAIVKLALPSVRHGLGFSVENLRWVISRHLLTYGGLLRRG